jgi:dihydroxy-acid dehydratase
MGAASANVPAILVTGGPSLVGNWQGQEVGSGTDFWRVSYDVRAGKVSQEDYRDFESSLCRSVGHCMEMATAMSMAVAGEAMGIALPDNAAIPAVDSRRLVLPKRSGRRAVELAEDGVRTPDIMTKRAFQNAIRVSWRSADPPKRGRCTCSPVAGRLGVPRSRSTTGAEKESRCSRTCDPSG